MPIPGPEKNEEKNKYISRCIKFLMDEGRPQKQALAICYDIWRKEMKEDKIIDKIDRYLGEGQYGTFEWIDVEFKKGKLIDVETGKPAINKKFKNEKEAEEYIEKNDLRITIR